MIELSLAEIAEATLGRCADADPAAKVTGSVVVDSREVDRGALFVAVAGDRVDGHDFAADAVAGGAAAVLAARPVGVPAVVVDDPVQALGRLARLVVRRLSDAPDPVLVVGVTGSQGKTGTKDLIAALLDPHGPTIAPPGSFNNEIGLPLTVLRADRATRHLVLEMGARGVGHIRYLCELSPPRIGVVLNVGVSHIGEFGSRDAIAVAKRELVEALPANGVAVLCADDPRVSAMAAHTDARVVLFGRSERAHVRATGAALDRTGRPVFDLRTPAGELTGVTLGLHGMHQVGNALAAVAVALEAGMSLPAVGAGLAAARPRSPWRMAVTDRADGVTVVNDSYNANPDSMRAALQTLVAIAGQRRSWAVLGEMRELGETSTAEHEAVGALAVRLGVSRLLLVGDGARAVRDGALGAGPCEPLHVATVDEALAIVGREVTADDVVLVKASRAVGLERLAEALTGPAGDRPAGESR